MRPLQKQSKRSMTYLHHASLMSFGRFLFITDHYFNIFSSLLLFSMVNLFKCLGVLWIPFVVSLFFVIFPMVVFTVPDAYTIVQIEKEGISSLVFMLVYPFLTQMQSSKTKLRTYFFNIIKIKMSGFKHKMPCSKFTTIRYKYQE